MACCRPSSAGCSTSPTTSTAARWCRTRESSATTATTRTSWWPPTRAPPPSRTSRTGSRSRRASGSATPSPPAARPATTTRRWASPRAVHAKSVKRHFRELGRDIQSEDFTAVGIGDMAGDVFGNGMLLSFIRLVGAFNHRHVFIDPDPDPERSFAERKRLFELPGSSWADYDPEAISAGERLRAHGQVDFAVGRGARGARHRGRVAQAERADPGAAGRPSTCSGTAASGRT